MAETVNNVALYEGLFLLNQSSAGDLSAVNEHLTDIFARAEAEVLVLRRWDERKLAYPIRGQKRGTYILAYFKARGRQIANIERDCNLSEIILRALITRADHLGETELQLQAQETPLADEARIRGEAAAAAAAPAPAAAQPEAEAAEAPAAEGEAQA